MKYTATLIGLSLSTALLTACSSMRSDVARGSTYSHVGGTYTPVSGNPSGTLWYLDPVASSEAVSPMGTVSSSGTSSSMGTRATYGATGRPGAWSPTGGDPNGTLPVSLGTWPAR